MEKLPLNTVDGTVGTGTLKVDVEKFYYHKDSQFIKCHATCLNCTYKGTFYLHIFF